MFAPYLTTFTTSDLTTFTTSDLTAFYTSLIIVYYGLSNVFIFNGLILNYISYFIFRFWLRLNILILNLRFYHTVYFF